VFNNKIGLWKYNCNKYVAYQSSKGKWIKVRDVEKTANKE
jgi:hypothetical protein